MGLLDDLRAAGKALDIQFQPSTGEVQGVVGALVHYIEHGDDFLKAVEGGAEDVEHLLVPAPAEPAAEPVAPAAPVEPAAAVEPVPPVAPVPVDEQSLSDDELAARISDLETLLASRQATAQQTTVTHETGAGDVPPAPPSPAI